MSRSFLEDRGSGVQGKAPLTMVSTSPLRLAVLGAGRIGSTVAYQMVCAGGHEVTAIARPDSRRLHQLARDGGIARVEGGVAGVRILDGLDEHSPYDLLIVTIHDHEMEPLIPALRRSAARCILLMFVTFQPERLRDAIGADRCAFAMPFLQADFQDNGKLKAVIGAGGQRTLVSESRWVDLFNSAGLPARLEANMPLWLRCHVPVCIAFQSIAVAGTRRGGGASVRDALRVARGVQVSFKMIDALGYPIYPALKRRMKAAPLWLVALVLWSLSRIKSFRELLATGREEGWALTDALLAASSQAQPFVPTDAIEEMRPI